MTLAYHPALFLIAFFISLAVSPLIRRLAFVIGAVDLPGERKIHSVPIPRLGGVVIALSCAVTLSSGMEYWEVEPVLDDYRPHFMVASSDWSGNRVFRRSIR